ncbi:MAG: choice-of-anchor Q domain-containing protein [Myxococcota bacterium]
MRNSGFRVDGASVELVDSDVLIDGTVIEGVVGGSAPAFEVWASGGQLHFNHSLITGAHRSCIKGFNGADVQIDGSIVINCGLLFGDAPGESMSHYAVVMSEAQAAVNHSIINASPTRPHDTALAGDVLLGEGVLQKVYPGLSGWAGRDGILVLSVDDRTNLDNALALSELMDGYGWKMTYFLNMRTSWGFDEEQWASLRDLVARGHDVGGHAATNARLPETIPLVVAWDGDGNSTVLISDAGTRLDVFVDDAPVLELDLTAPETDVMQEVCEKISALPNHRCWYGDLYSSAQSVYVDATALADGVRSLNGEGIGLAYDNRLPSEGGRRFGSELVHSRDIIESQIGDLYQVVSFAYPGQEHDPVVRDAVADAGYHIARGANNYQRADHLLTRPIDRFQSPMSLSNVAIRGADYASLAPAEQRARIDGFVQTWAAMAMEYGGLGAVTLHGAESFSPEEMGWLLDAIARTDLTVMSMRDLSAWFDQEVGDMRALEMTVDPNRDHRLSEGSAAIDAGAPGSRDVDAAGRPIYGAPDLGPFEFQPTRTLSEQVLTVGQSLRLYADRRIRVLEAGTDSPAGLSVVLQQAVDLGPQEPRPALFDLKVRSWDDVGREWRIQNDGAIQKLCVMLTGLEPNARMVMARDGVGFGGFRVDEAGTARVLQPVGRGDQIFAVREATLLDVQAPLASCSGEAAVPVEEPPEQGQVFAVRVAGDAARARAPAGCATNPMSPPRSAGWLWAIILIPLCFSRRD